MIPLKLKLKNFLSYGENSPEIDFKDHSLICFSGKNGNGKSAILDAITWAVWGQARKVSGTIKPDAGLLRLGQTRMMVSFEFEFGQNVYRVRREFAKTHGKPYAVLDLEIMDKTDENFISLTDKTIRQTQLKIEKLVGLDYETFTNSAFLRQGQADEFSKKSPKERKQILSNILGFSRYDELQTLALEQARKLQDEHKLGLKLQEQSEEQLQKEKDIKKEQSAKKETLEKIGKEFDGLQKGLQSQEKEKNIIVLQKQRFMTLLKEEKDLSKVINLKQEELKKVVGLWKTVHYNALSLPNITKLEKERDELAKKSKNYLSLQQKSLTFQELILQKKDVYGREFRAFKEKKEKQFYQQKLSLEKKELGRKQVLDLIDQKEKIKKELKICLNESKKELSQIEKEIAGRKEFEKELTKISAQFEKRRSFYQVLVQKGNWVKSQLQELENKSYRIKEQDSPCCPLCEQVLTVRRKQFLGSKFEKDSKFLSGRFSRLSTLIGKLKKILLQQHEQHKKLLEKDDFYKQMIVRLQSEEKNFKQYEKELQSVTKNILQLEEQEKALSKELKADKDRLTQDEGALEKQLEEESTLKQLVLGIKKIEQEKIELKYDKKAHISLEEELKKTEEKLQELTKIRQDLLDQKERKNRIHAFVLELKELKQKTAKVAMEVKTLNFDETIEKVLDDKISNVKLMIDKKTKEKELVIQELGSFENELKRIKKIKEENEQREKHLNILKDEIEEYQLLAQSFGKNGIQALLIEQVIPQIEDEANNILARLSNNQSQVFIESLRDLKNGGVKETLDIQISDTAGIRPYEMFSGGEAFRVDFALRIAISKLLARRAGTALQTLIIDEGFGSQDEEGLALLMDAIYAILADFSKIIVVTHLTGFKENFPAHFLVDKNATGSFVRVETRG